MNALIAEGLSWSQAKKEKKRRRQQRQEEQRRQEEEQRQREEVEHREEEERRQRQEEERLERENVERGDEDERRQREEVELRVREEVDRRVREEVERHVREEVERRVREEVEQRQREEVERRELEENERLEREENERRLREENVHPSNQIETWNEERSIDDVIADIIKLTQFTETSPKGSDEVGHQFYQVIERDDEEHWGLSTVTDISNDGDVIITSSIDGVEVEGSQTLGARDYNNLINSERIVHLQISEHQEIVDSRDEERYTLSEVERQVVCHGSRNETDAAQLQRRLHLLYGLNLSVEWHQEAKKRKIREAISSVIQEMKALGITGDDALRTDVEAQAAAFSPISQLENRPNTNAYAVSSSIPCYETPNLVQATSALFTATNLSTPGVEFMVCPERFRLKRNTFCELKENCILVVSDHNLWFIAFHDEETDTVGLHISGSPNLESSIYRTISVPARYITQNNQYCGMSEHILFCWIWATNFYPLGDVEGDHINGKKQDNRRSNVTLRTTNENGGNKRNKKRAR
jgi:hypothetical protein